MAKVVYASLKPQKSGRRPSVGTKRVTGADGTSLLVYKVKADSPTFGEDMSYVFRQSVAKARREHKRLLGSAAKGSGKGPAKGPVSVPPKG